MIQSAERNHKVLVLTIANEDPYHEKPLQRQSSTVALRKCYWLTVSLLLNLMPTLILMKVLSSGSSYSQVRTEPALSALIFRKSSF